MTCVQFAPAHDFPPGANRALIKAAIRQLYKNVIVFRYQNIWKIGLLIMCVKFGTVETENITLTIDRNFFDKLEI